MRRNLTEDNLKFSLDCHSTASRAITLYHDAKYEELEELLRVEWQKAQDRAIVLQKMYTEVANRNLRSELFEEELG